QYQIPWIARQTDIQEGKISSTHTFLEWDGPKLAFTSLKVNEDSQDVMARWYNMSDADEQLKVSTPYETAAVYKSNILEEKKEKLEQDKTEINIDKHEIVTLGFSLK